MSAIRHFLLVFNHEIGQLVRLERFETDAAKALAAYSETEREFKDSPMMDIVLVGSDSIDTVKLTHANYFDGSAAVTSRFLTDI